MQDIKNLIVQVAPTIASAMGGPFSGVALKFMADNLLPNSGDSSTDNGSVEEALRTALSDADGLLKLKELDKDFQAEMKKLDVDVYALEVHDRHSARAAAAKDNRPQIYMSVAFIVTYFLLLAGVFWAEISPNYNPGMAFKDGQWVEQGQSLIDLFKVLIGVLTAGVGQILNFWFGGTKSTSTSD